MRAPFAYFGGKARLAPAIVKLFPEHQAYMEPYAGSLAVFFHKPPVRHQILNDLDCAVATFFRVLRDQPEELERVCRLTPHSRTEFMLANLSEPGLTDLEIARRFWVRVNQSFVKTAATSSGWSVTTSRTQSVPASVAARIGRFADCANLLSAASIENCDGAALVRRLANDQTLIYVDPPYFEETRTARRKGPMTDYRTDMGCRQPHVDLADALRSTPATVFVSGYPCDLYGELYDGWDFVDFEVAASSGSRKAGAARGRRIERVWSNRPILRSDGEQLTLDATA